MTNEQLIEELQKLPEIDLKVVIGGLFDHIIHNGQDHLIISEIEEREMFNQEIEDLRDEIIDGDLTRIMMQSEIDKLQKTIEQLQEKI